MTAAAEVEMVPVDAITVLNPRARNRRIFHELVTSIAHLGLKKPITVSRRGSELGYHLVCGQGRLEAFIAQGKARSRRLSCSATSAATARRATGAASCIGEKSPPRH